MQGTPTYLGLEGPGVADVPLQGIGRELGGDDGIAVLVEADDVLGEFKVDILVALVEDDEEEVEAGHDRGGHGDVGAEAYLAVVAATDRVGGGEDRGAGIEGGLDAGLGDGDGLLLHGLVDGDLVGDVHLIKLVDGADAVVGEHEGAGLDGELARLLVLDDSRRQTCCRRCLARGVD